MLFPVKKKVFFFQLKKPANGIPEQPGTSSEGATEGAEQPNVPSDIFDYYDKMDKEDEDSEDLKTVSFEVKAEHIETIQKRFVDFAEHSEVLNF